MSLQRVCLTGVVVLLVGTVSETFAQVRRQPPPRAESTDTPPTAEAETTSSASPTTTEAPSTEPAQAQADRSFNLFGETNRFNRFSGWGGIGGTMGQWGMNRSMLIMMPQVQQELALTDDQKLLLREWSLEMRDRGREMAEAMRPNRDEDDAPGRGFPSVGNVMGMMGMMTQILKENETGIAQILDKGQRRRLDQIALQMEGATALARPEVAQAVGLLPVQVEAIQQVLAQSRTQQVFYWIQQSTSMWGNRGRPPGADANRAGTDPGPTARPRGRGRPAPPDPAAAPPANRPSSRSDEDGDDNPAARAEREARFREQFEQLRSGSDQIQDRTVQEIMKILNRNQRQRFDKLLGPPFDPAALTFETRRPNEQREDDATPPGAVRRTPAPSNPSDDEAEPSTP
ncbi:Spy/CpxP family protein refolding chaperone [Tautonia rosea]|uniref:Spy/CpxP family protein refolding chaperone n=1 Tax=Tautonia rosea TaxID=2728037 RepID=UPI00147506D9|nr:Spy/CpxP family protein refolding chaperone [Tautonia rosea]